MANKTRTMSLIGKKLGMTSVFTDDGSHVNVTVLEVGPCRVVAKRTTEKNGYEALQLGFGEVAAYRKNKPEMGHFKVAGQAPARHLREIRLPAGTVDQYEVGQELKCDLFQTGELVDVQGTSKGKGFQGVMKRHNFAGFRATHGTHEYFRHGGGISAREKPGKVWKNKKMPGHLGDETVTVQNLKVVSVRPEENLVLVQGAVPGAVGSLVRIQKARKAAIRDAHAQAKAG